MVVWMKATSLFSKTYGDRKLNPQVLFFDGHDSHFDDEATHLLRSNHISPFIIKAGDSTNNQWNVNDPNLKLKRYYVIAKVKWQIHHGTIKFNAAHMNYILVKMWHSFQQQSTSIIIEALKNKLLTFAPPDHNTNAQACLSATQTPFGIKSEEIEDISRTSMEPG